MYKKSEKNTLRNFFELENSEQKFNSIAKSHKENSIENFLTEIKDELKTHKNNFTNKQCNCKNKNTKCQNCFENNCMLQSYRQGILDGMCFCNQPKAPAPAPAPEPIPEDPIETKTLPISDSKSESISETAPNQQIVNEEFVNNLAIIEGKIDNELEKLIDFLKNNTIKPNNHKTIIANGTLTINDNGLIMPAKDLNNYDVIQYGVIYKGKWDKLIYDYSFGFDKNKRTSLSIRGSFLYDNKSYINEQYIYKFISNTNIFYNASTPVPVEAGLTAEIIGINF